MTVVWEIVAWLERTPTCPRSGGGATIPKLGLGTWQNTGEQCAETVETALELIRHLLQGP